MIVQIAKLTQGLTSQILFVVVKKRHELAFFFRNAFSQHL